MLRKNIPATVENALHQIDRVPNNLQLQTERPMPIHAVGIFGSAVIGVNTGVSESDFHLAGIGAEVVTSQPPFIAATVLAMSGLTYARQLRVKQVVKKNSERQQTIRDALNEDVDIIKNDTVLNLRWYGADEQWSNRDDNDYFRDIAHRAKHIAEFASINNIPNIAVGSSLFGNYVSDTAGELDTSEFIQDQTKSRISIHDRDVDETVLIISPEELTRAAELITNSLEENTHALIEKLIDGVKDISLKRAYTAYQRNPSRKSLQFFTKLAATTLVPFLDNGSHNSIVMNEYGTIEQRRTTVMPRIEGSKIKAQQSWQSSGGSHGVEMAPSESLVKILGYDTQEELYKDFVDKSVILPHERKHALATIYLLGRDLDDTQVAAKPATSSKDSARRVRKQTTLQAFDADKVTSFPRLRSSGIEKDRLSYSRNRSLGRSAAIIMMYAAALTTGYFGGGDASHEAVSTTNKAYGDASELVGTKAFNSAYEKNIAESGNFRRTLVDTTNNIQEMNYQIASYMVDKYISIFGKDIADLITIGKAGLYWQDSIQSLPSDMFASSLNKSITGDVENSQSRNKPVYSITSLSGKPTNGYWFTDLYSDAYFGLNSEVAPGAYVSFSKKPNEKIPLSLPWKQKDIDSLRADYMVSTPYVDGDMQLPTLQNGKIIAAAIVDKKDASRRIEVTIEQDSKTGTYEMITSKLQENLDSNDIDEPELQYYVQLSDGPIVHYQEATTIDRSARINTEEVAQAAKEALGLQSTATNEEVYAAIKAKKYSYTPFKDNGITSNLYSDDETDDFQKIAEEFTKTLAQLESLNCNLASALDLLATDSGGASELQQVSGFNNNGDDFLVQGEAHAWLIDNTSTIVDPTPSNTLPEQNDKVSGYDSHSISYTQWGGILVATAFTIMAARRRRKIIEDMKNARVNYTLEHPKTGEALGHIQAALYGHPNRATTSYMIDVTHKMLSTIPAEIKANDVIERRASQGVDLADQYATQRAIRRVLRTPRR